jgi:glyoxylase-like metal-dependent hydrolase (beta-lactamase superfamily II)
VRPIDLLHLGRDRVICCYEVGDVLVDPGPTSCVDTLLRELDGREPRALLLTHIHLDHAGATGTLAERWPDLEIYVHERGAPHLIDPRKLVESARRLYGDEMDRLWGEIVPVPEANLRVLTGGESIGPWRVQYTPGHASHHVSYLHEPTGTAFVGDVGGVRVEGGPIIPPTPPPDIDIELWHESLRTIAAWDPERLAVTHFGSYDDVGDQIAAMHEALDRWAALALETDAESYAAAMIAEMEQAPDATAMQAFLQAMPPDTLWPGLDRYWSKKNR